jgi:hypothetical protein
MESLRKKKLFYTHIWMYIPTFLKNKRVQFVCFQEFTCKVIKLGLEVYSLVIECMLSMHDFLGSTHSKNKVTNLIHLKLDLLISIWSFLGLHMAEPDQLPLLSLHCLLG